MSLRGRTRQAGEGNANSYSVGPASMGMVSPPEYQVHAAFDVMVEMRDGTELATDIYRPADPDTGEPVERPQPVLLERTPYNKRESSERHGHWFAERGYVVAIQDCRGRFDSEGEFSLLVNEPEDGHDTVEWLAEQPYCDGQVGTIGTSYGAWVQNALATQDPDGLAAMFVNQGGANGWEATLRHNGAFELRWLCWALAHGGGFAKRALENPPVQQLLANVDTGDVLANGPIRRGQSPLRHLPGYEDWVFDLMTSEGTDELWRSPGINFEEYATDSADVPTVYAGGWYDSYTKATCDNFVEFDEQKDSDHYLLMGPWTHGWDAYPQPSWNKPYSGELDFGSEATREYQRTRLRFFDHYLKGEATWDDEPSVQYWCMGTGDGHRDGVRLRSERPGTHDRGELFVLPHRQALGEALTRISIRGTGLREHRAPRWVRPANAARDVRGDGSVRPTGGTRRRSRLSDAAVGRTRRGRGARVGHDLRIDERGRDRFHGETRRGTPADRGVPERVRGEPL